MQKLPIRPDSQPLQFVCGATSVDQWWKSEKNKNRKSPVSERVLDGSSSNSVEEQEGDPQGAKLQNVW